MYEFITSMFSSDVYIPIVEISSFSRSRSYNQHEFSHQFDFLRAAKIRFRFVGVIRNCSENRAPAHTPYLREQQTGFPWPHGADWLYVTQAGNSSSFFTHRHTHRTCNLFKITGDCSQNWFHGRTLGRFSLKARNLDFSHTRSQSNQTTDAEAN